MFSFLQTAKVKPDLSFIGVDMHSHLLPGLDDGLKELEQTITFVKDLQELGYSKLICTPHIIADLYPNGPSTILPKLDLVREALLKENIDVQIEAGAEYMVDVEMENYLQSGEPLLTFGKNFILIEMSYVAPSSNMERVIFQLRMKGLQPIIAHPERYSYLHNKFDTYQRFIDLGCILQVNLLSLLGYYGPNVKIIAEKLVTSNMITLAGTDMHHETHLQALKDLAAKKSFYKLLEKAGINNKELLG